MNAELAKKIINGWAGGLPLKKQVVVLFERVRDIPYGSIGSRDPEKVYRLNKGTCSGKHALLKGLYQALGLEVLDCVAMHRFKDLPVKFPPRLREILDRSDIIDPHNLLKVKIDGKWVTVDATWDKLLKKLGFPVNEGWDGESDMAVCVVPLEVREVDDPLAFKKARIDALPKQAREDRELFLKELTGWLDGLRRKGF